MTSKQLIISFLVGISSGCYGMQSMPYHAVLHEIIQNGGCPLSAPHHEGAMLTDGQLIELAQAIMSDEHYQNLSGYAVQLLDGQKDCSQVLRVLSRAFMQRYGALISLRNLLAHRQIPARYAWRVQEVSLGVSLVYVPAPVSMIGAFNNGQRVGTLEWTGNENGYHIDLLAVDSRYRKQGIATALMVLALQFFTQKKHSEPCLITLDAVAGDPSAVNQERLVDFYRSYGFKFLDDDVQSKCRMILWLL